VNVLTRDRRLWVVAGALVAGVVIGLIVSYTSFAKRRAEASVLISSNRGPSAVDPFLPDLRTLATSSLLAGNIRSTLRLSESAETVRSRLHATIRPNTQVIAISATGKDGRSAQQLAQEGAVVFALLVGERFKTTTPPLHASVLDPAHVLGGPDRHIGRNTVVGGLLGLVLGTVASVLFGTRPPHPAQAPPTEVRELMRREKLLERRITTVASRERELASRAALVTTQERELEKRRRDVEKHAAARAAPPPAPKPEPVPRPDPVVSGPPASPQPEPEPRLVTPSPRIGGWNIHELEALVAANDRADPGVVEEWRAYLFFLRDHASADGWLPPQFDSLIDEVFGALAPS
jgi:hypothetical protein